MAKAIREKQCVLGDIARIVWPAAPMPRTPVSKTRQGGPIGSVFFGHVAERIASEVPSNFQDAACFTRLFHAFLNHCEGPDG